MLRERLNVDGRKAFSSACNKSIAAASWVHLPQKGALQQGCKPLTVEEFVSQTLPLLELERDAEVAQVDPGLPTEHVHTCLSKIYLFMTSLRLALRVWLWHL